MQNYTCVEPSKKMAALKRAFNAFFLLCVLFAIALMSFSFIYMGVEVVGPSMQPTINAEWSESEDYKQDIAYINRLDNTVTRGDIIVVETSQSVYVIKRLIALGGDRIKIEENAVTHEIEVYLNGDLLVEDYVVYKSGLSFTLANFNLLKANHPEYFDGDELVVPDNYIFYLGDNRGQSLDCSTYGPVSIDEFVGRVDIIIPYGTNFFVYFWQKFVGIFS